jgi:hypothetical protein
MDEHYGPRMIRFEAKTTVRVSKCDRNGVIQVRSEMEKKKKLLPFFILDEMTSNANDGLFPAQRL